MIPQSRLGKATVVLLFLLASLAFYGYQHENTHVQVYRQFGCPSSVHVGYLKDFTFPVAYTLAENCTASKELSLAQANAETVGYHTLALIIILHGLLIVKIGLDK